MGNYIDTNKVNGVDGKIEVLLLLRLLVLSNSNYNS